MTKLSLATALLLGAAAMAVALPAAATTNQRTAQKAWTDSDKCAKEAFEKYPDYTPEETAKRDAFTRRCLNGRNLPGRSSAAPKP
jgi:hypothetical protein